MSVELLHATLFFKPAIGPEETLKKVATFVDRFRWRGSPVRSLDREGDAMLETADVAAFVEGGQIVMLVHDDMNKELGEEWMLQIVLNSLYGPEEAELEVSAEPSDQAVLEPNWEFMTAALNELTAVFTPTLALCNGMSTDEEIDDLPSFDEIRDGEFPPVITPWTYVGSDRLNATARAALQALPVFRSEPLGDGWVVQAVEHYGDKAPAGFRSQLKAVGKRIKYTHTR